MLTVKKRKKSCINILSLKVKGNCAPEAFLQTLYCFSRNGTRNVQI